MSDEKVKVLIVDDDEVVVEVTSAGLEINGFDVSSAPNGIEGVKKVGEISPDVVLLDLRLPDIDGFEVLRRIRAKQENSDIHIIMITGDRTIDIDKAFALGADDCIIKPVDMKVLAERIFVLTKKKYRVLAVEDDRQICAVLKSVLEKQDYEVFIHHDGGDIIKKILRDKPDLVLLDISLPVGPDGVELCRIVKNDPATKSIPVVMLTANQNSESLDKCFSIGAADYIFKPFSMPDLMSKIKKYIRVSSKDK